MTKPNCPCDHCQGIVWPIPKELTEADQERISRLVAAHVAAAIKEQERLVLESLSKRGT